MRRPCGSLRLSRRAFLRRAARASALALAGVPSGAAAAPPAAFSFLPASFEVTSRSALLWFRLGGPGEVRAEYGLDRRLSDSMRTPPAPVLAANDFTAAIALSGLQPGRRYFFRGAASLRGGREAKSAVARFRTAPERAEEFSFAFGGDLKARYQPFKILDRVAEKDPHFFLMVGDTVYADRPRWEAAETLPEYRAKHRENRKDPHLQRMLSRMGVFAVWDDHEVANDFDRSHPRIPQGRKAFTEYWPVRTGSADPSVLHRSVSWGPAADFFLLDCRQYRTDMNAPDGPAKTMLGATQKAWLKERLRASRAPFKFIVSSVPFNGQWRPDKWSGYGTEREELRRFFREEKIGGVIFLSTDVHLAMDLPGPGGIREFIAGPLGTRPKCVRRPWREAELRVNVRSRFFNCYEYNYARVVVRPQKNPPEAEVSFLDRSNRVLYRTVQRGKA